MLTISDFFVDCAPPHRPTGGRERQKASRETIAKQLPNLLVRDLFTTHGLGNTESVFHQSNTKGW